MQDYNTSKYSERLKFIQLMKNSALHSWIKRSPFKAMFGCLNTNETEKNLLNSDGDHLLTDPVKSIRAIKRQRYETIHCLEEQAKSMTNLKLDSSTSRKRNISSNSCL